MRNLLCFFLFSGLAFAQNSTRMLSGVNVVTTSPYTFTDTDATRLVSFNSPTAILATIPPGSTPNFGAGRMFSTINIGAGSTTITCSGCLIYVNSSTGASTLVLAQGQGIDLYSAGLNYYGFSGASSVGGSGSSGIANLIQMSAGGGAFASAAGFSFTSGTLTIPTAVQITGASGGTYVKADGTGFGTPAGSGTLNAAQQFSLAHYSGAGSNTIVSGIAAPTGVNGVPQIPFSTPSGGVATTMAFSPGGIPTRALACSGNTDTILATDRAQFTSESDASACTLTLPQANTTGFDKNFVFVNCNNGAGAATITPTTSTISYYTGSNYVSAASSMALTTGQCAWVYSDNTNYIAIQSGTSAGLSQNLYTEATSAGVTTNSASGSAVPMFTGYTIPASKLTAGHRIVAKACFKHTGSNASTFSWSIGGSAANTFLSGTALVSLICSQLDWIAIDNTHQQSVTTNNASSNVTPVQAATTYTLTGTNTINVTQAAAGTADIYTAYSLTVDLY